MVLTYGSIRNQGLVVEAESLSEVIEIRMLHHQVPLRIVHVVVEICDGDFNSPVGFVVNFDMPVYSYWTHMVCTLDQRRYVQALPCIWNNNRCYPWTF